MSQLPVMTPFDLTLENELNVEVQRFNNGWLFKWYGMTYAGGQTDVDDFRGGRIQYAGIKFDHQQREIFWDAIDRYLDQKVHETFKQWDAETPGYSIEVRRKSIDSVERTLRRFVSRIVAHGKETDQRLRGNGHPERVSPADDIVAHVYTEAEISNLAVSHRMLLDQNERMKEAEQAAAASPQKPTEILSLKLGWAGISIDLKEVARRGLRWWHGKGK